MKEFYLKFMGTACMTLAMAGAMHAEVLQPADALSRALSQATAPAKAPSRSAAANMQLTGTFNANDGLPAAYMFTSAETDATGNPSAFALVAADDVVPSMLLGYSDAAPATNGLNSIPPALHRLILDYAAEIEFLRATGAQSAPASRAEADTREPILPMVTTHWNQNMPYNSKCPIVDETYRCVTGCVATAMAQVMNYHKWPKTAHGSSSYILDIHNPYTGNSFLGLNLSMDFEGLQFDWDNMLDDYIYTKVSDDVLEPKFTAAQGDAVATLMKACGYAVEIGYGPYETYGYDINVLYALLKYFDYDKSVHILQRQHVRLAAWEDAIYTNLMDYGPVYMSGQSTGGHAFVIDGYSSDRFFHVNWGWGGTSDGYFRLTAMDPSQQGIGAATTTGYNYYQWAMLGIRPNTGNDKFPPAVLCVPGGLSQWNTTINEYNVMSVNTHINNFEHYDAKGRLALWISEVSSLNGITVEGDAFNLQANYAQAGMNFKLPTTQPEGTYFAYLLNSDDNYPEDGYRFVRSHVSNESAIVLQFKDGQWSVLQDFALSGVSVTIDQESTDKVHFSGIPSQIALKVENGDQNGNEVYGDGQILLYDDEDYFAGTIGYARMALLPGESNTYYFYNAFFDNTQNLTSPGTYNLCVQVTGVGLFDLGKITLLDPSAVECKLSVGNVVLSDPSAPMDLTDLRLETDVQCMQGAHRFLKVAMGFYVDNNFLGCARGLEGYIKEGQWFRLTAMVNVSRDVPEGSTLRATPVEWDGTNYIPLDPDKYWEYTNSSSGIESTVVDQTSAITFTYDASAAVLNVASMACIRSIEVFNASGSLVLSENHSDDMLLQTALSLHAMPRGAYIVKATDNDGNSATHKLLR